MEIPWDRTEERIRLIVDGELDMATGPNLECALQGAESEAPALLILDLSALRFMDCTGLHLILAAHERTAAAGRRLALICGPRAVQRVFELTGTDQTLEFLEDPTRRTQALAPEPRPAPIPAVAGP